MKVIFNGSSNNYSVKLKSESQQNFNVTQSETVMANRFVDLTDVNISNLDVTKDNHAVVYDATSGKFKIVNPDSVLSAASSVGLSSTFINTLDIELDNKIDVDAGSF